MGWNYWFIMDVINYPCWNQVKHLRSKMGPRCFVNIKQKIFVALPHPTSRLMIMDDCVPFHGEIRPNVHNLTTCLYVCVCIRENARGLCMCVWKQVVGLKMLAYQPNMSRTNVCVRSVNPNNRFHYLVYHMRVIMKFTTHIFLCSIIQVPQFPTRLST